MSRPARDEAGGARPRLEFVALGGVAAALLETFASGDRDLDEFIKADAAVYEAALLSRTFVALAGQDMAGFVSLLADSIRLETKERRRLGVVKEHPALPALKIGRLASARDIRDQVRGIGRELVRFGVNIALDVGERLGVRLVTVDAYPAAVPFYERLGFVRNRAKEYRDRSTVSMRLDIQAGRRPGWLEEEP